MPRQLDCVSPCFGLQGRRDHVIARIDRISAYGGLFGAAASPGRRVRAKEDTPLCNLYLAMMRHMGIDQVAEFGDSTQPLEGLG